MNRLDHLRGLAARHRRAPAESNQALPGFADKLVQALARYLGEPGCVALTRAQGEFSFDQPDDADDGLRLERGVFRMPLMFRLPGVAPDTDLLIRLRLYLTRTEGARFDCQIEDAVAFPISIDDPNVVAMRVYEYLCFACSSPAWFARHQQHHRTVRRVAGKGPVRAAG